MSRRSGGAGTRCELGDWSVLRDGASRVRMAVFVDEQGFPAHEEFDDADTASIHALLHVDGVAVATGRLLPDDRIGRMAVLRPYRGTGLGAVVLERLVEAARRRGALELKLSSQLQACGFYARHGFEAEGPVYDDTGVPHVTMRRVLRSTPDRPQGAQGASAPYAPDAPRGQQPANGRGDIPGPDGPPHTEPDR